MSKVAVTYRAPKGDEKVVETRGLTFFDGQAQELDTEEHAGFLAKAKDNPHFIVGEVGDAEQPNPIDEMSIAELRAEAEKRGIPHEGVGKAELRNLLRQ